MTSIHASIPDRLLSAAAAARERGESTLIDRKTGKVEAKKVGKALDRSSSSKENAIMLLDPGVHAMQSPNHSTHSKRPLSDRVDNGAGKVLLSSEDMTVVNTPELASGADDHKSSTAEEMEGLHIDKLVSSAPSVDQHIDKRPGKKLCSDEAKGRGQSAARPPEMHTMERPKSSLGFAHMTTLARIASAPDAIKGAKLGKPRVGLRRL